MGVIMTILVLGGLFVIIYLILMKFDNAKVAKNDAHMAKTTQFSSILDGTKKLSIGDQANIDGSLWNVVAVKEGAALILRHCLLYADAVNDDRLTLSGCAYTEDASDTTWENSVPRKILNETYYNSLPDKLKERIIKTKLTNKSTWATEPETEDYVFIPSVQDLVDWGIDTSRKNLISSIGIDIQGLDYWLRVRSNPEPTCVPVVDGHGAILYYGDSTFMCKNTALGRSRLRPAMWIKI